MYGKRPPLDEQKSLWEATLAAEGVTTGAGTAAGDNFIDAGLIGVGANSFVSMLAILYPGDPQKVDSKDITAFDDATGKVTLAGAYKGVAALIPAGVPYKIVTFRFVPAEVAALAAAVAIIDGFHDIPGVDAVTNAQMRDVIGQKGDAANETASQASIIGLLRAVITTYLNDGTIGLAAVQALIGAINATTTDSLHGKLGTDTELADYSFYDLLGGNAFKTNALSAMLGAFTAAQNLKAILGNLTTTKNLGGILGALTTTDNLKAILGAYTAAANLKAAIDAITTQTDKIAGKMLFSMDFWSVPQEEVALTGTAGDKTLPSVTIADLPGTATIVRAIAMFKFRMIENHTYAGANDLDGAQEIQVKPTAGAYTDAINFVTGQFALAQDTREGGDIIIGAIDIAGSGKVEANGVYDFLWDEAWAEETGINFNDVQVGLRIWYSV